MSGGIELTGIDGTNPLGFLAALGTLGALDRIVGGEARLHWTETVLPRPVVTGVGSIEEIIDHVLADRDRWIDAPALEWNMMADIKLSSSELHEYACVCRDADDGGRSAGLFAGLLAEGSYDGKGASKPSDLHFTAGQQKFLSMARELRDGLNRDRLVEALVGPWRFDSKLPSLGWEISDDRVYALSASDPSRGKKLSVPAAEWLGLCGLALVPVAATPAGTHTSGGTGTWKRGAWSWNLWTQPASRFVVPSLAFNGSSPDAASLTTWSLRRRAESRIRRTDQGGYGSFGPPTVTEVM